LETRIEKLSQCEKEIFFTLDSQELKPYFDKAYQDAQKNIKVQGFRPGKVPLQMIKKMYGKAIERDTADEIINDVFNNFLKENTIGFYGQPHMHHFEQSSEFLKFSLHIEVEPEFELADYKDLVVDEPVHKVNQEEIDNQLEQILARKAKSEPAESVSDYYHVVGVNIFVLDNEGNRPQDVTPIKEFLYLNQPGIFPQIKESLLNTKGGEIVKIELPESNGIPARTLELEILEIQKLILPEPNEEFIKEVSDGKFTTIEDFKEDIGFKLQEEWDKLGRKELENNLVNRIMDTQPQFDIPKSLVQLIADNLFKADLKKRNLEDNEQNRKKLFNDTYIANARNVARWQIILDNIIKKENLEIEDHDIEGEITPIVEQYNIDREIIKSKVLEDKDFINSLLVKKAMDFILDFTVTNEVQFSGDLNVNFNSYEEDFDEDEDEFDEEEFDEEEFDEDDFDDEDFEDEDFDDDDEDDYDEEDDDDDEDEDDDEEEEDDDDDKK